MGALTPIAWLINHNPKLAFHVWVPSYLVEFARHVLPRRCLIRPFTEQHLFRKKFQFRTTEWVETGPTAMRIHATDFGFITLADRLPLPNERNTLQIRPDQIDIRRFDLPEKYVAMQGSFTEPVKTMPVETANAVSKFIQCHGYIPVLLGKEESGCGFKDFAIRATSITIETHGVIDLRNQSSLLETAAIIAGSKCFIGMEGGLCHLAGSTDAQIVAAFTLGDPTIHAAPIRCGSSLHRMRAIIPGPEAQNRFWQTHASNFDRGDPRYFPGWQKLRDELATPENFIRELENIL